jgi:hypothetical protein
MNMLKEIRNKQQAIDNKQPGCATFPAASKANVAHLKGQ